MFFKIIKQSNYRLLLSNYHKYSRLKIEFDLLDRELGEEFPFIKEVTAHLRKTDYPLDLKELATKLRKESDDIS